MDTVAAAACLIVSTACVLCAKGLSKPIQNYAIVRYSMYLHVVMLCFFVANMLLVITHLADLSVPGMWCIVLQVAMVTGPIELRSMIRSDDLEYTENMTRAGVDDDLP
jgi:uncharacterized membrane protein YhaH (DUF805 family)